MHSPKTKRTARQLARDIADLAQELGADTPVEHIHLLQKGWSAQEIERYHNSALQHLCRLFGLQKEVLS